MAAAHEGGIAPAPARRSARAAKLSQLAQTMLSKTSKSTSDPGILMLADGTVFYGRSCGAPGTAVGEVCFNTSLEGYFEVLTDPSYAGQIVTMTYPQIGNYGVDVADTQTAPGMRAEHEGTPAVAARGMIVRDMCRTPSNWRSTMSLPEFLDERGVVALEGVDTRELVRHLRDHGAQKGIISTEEFDPARLAGMLNAAPDLVGANLVETVSCEEAFAYDGRDRAARDRSFAMVPAESARHRVVVYDCGVKRAILEGLARADAR